MPLSDLKCRNAKPAAKDYKLADELALYLLIRPTGSKLWRMNYAFEGKQKTLSFGPYPKINLSDARIRRDRARASLRAGVDPTTQDETLPSREFENVARAWFEARRHKWVTSYSSRIWSRLEDDVFPTLGKRDVASITPKEVLSVLRKIEDRDAIEMARRIRQTMSQIFRYAVAEGWTSTDPASVLTAAMKSRPPQQHRAALTETELPEFMKRIDNYQGLPQTSLALRLIAHVFVRSNELRFAEWSEFDGDRWRIPAERMKMRKEHLVPLSKQAQKIVEQLRIEARGSKWVLPGDGGTKPVSENTLIYAMYRLGYHSRATVHGWRGTASTILNESGLWRVDAIERQLAHVPKDAVRSAYNAAQYWDERVRMMQWYSDRLEGHAVNDPHDLSDILN